MTEDDKRFLGELMERISKGDKSAHDILAQKFYRTVYCFIFRITGSEADAQDLTQETFLRLYRHDFSVKIWTNSYVYLFQIAKNLCLDRYRKLKKNESIFNSEIEKFKRYIWDGPEELDSIFSNLSAQEEQLVLLRYGSGYSVKEISKKTKIPKRTLERKFNEIRQKIKKAVEDAENER